ncbi:hypothetical protein KFE98_18075 [bacterium SCSIO 12741]|nr:hypothetical protein KFE98_18075 [bacterium SCSIO 12741]
MKPQSSYINPLRKKWVRLFFLMLAIVLLTDHVISEIIVKQVNTEWTEKGEQEGEKEAEEKKNETEIDDYLHLVAIGDCFVQDQWSRFHYLTTHWHDLCPDILTPPPELYSA